MIYLSGPSKSIEKLNEIYQKLVSEGFTVHYPFVHVEDCTEKTVINDLKKVWHSSILIRVVDENPSEGAPHEAHEAFICHIPVVILNLTGKDLDPWTKFFSNKEARSVEELLTFLREKK
jgi:hypothetical protein